ncbi:GPI transamidase component GPI16 [Apiospora kogelbergensis]|uniref:GPI transamidase component GPI16 n=1 Tax=Apiospora kogelbergensis TaxID=1337665 RepID=UPI003130F2E4
MQLSFTSLIPLLPFFLSPVSASTAPAAADYHEQLNLKPLPQNSLLASFNFRSNTSLPEFEAHNFRFFPRSLGQILQHAGTRELHLRFSLGRWDAETWGARPWDGTKEGGTGVELWAWLDAESDAEADQKWLTLTNALSGLFCASLNFIDSTRTTRPVMSFRPEGDHPNTTMDNMHLLHGVLPREVVCTENLTPFLKLLPCKGKAGVSSLLDGHKLFDASWQSMAIDVKPVCPVGEECVLQIEQTIDMVLDIERSKRPRDNPIPRPIPGHELKCNTTKPYHAEDTCFPTDSLNAQEWTLDQIFAPHSRDVFTSMDVQELKESGNENQRCYLLPSNEEEFHLALPFMPRDGDRPKTDADEFVQPATPLLYAERSLTGHGQEHGGVQAILTNPSPDSEVEFVYMESLPWFMRIYLHTLKARISHRTGSDAGQTLRDDDEVIQEIYYRPFLDRKRGTHTVFMSYDFEKTILRYTEYPPDANRGFDVAAAVITILPSNSTAAAAAAVGKVARTSNLRTTGMLLNLPTPDFSMPYNVIIFTSTCIALAFGGLYNILVRRFVGRDEGPEVSLVKLRRRLQEAVQKLKGRIQEKLGVASKEAKKLEAKSD